MDLGFDCVYVLSLKETIVRSFGETGKKNGQFWDPAGLVSDQFGNTIIADSRNHRLQVKPYFTHCQIVTIQEKKQKLEKITMFSRIFHGFFMCFALLIFSREFKVVKNQILQNHAKYDIFMIFFACFE